jgi:hypothetical protein
VTARGPLTWTYSVCRVVSLPVNCQPQAPNQEGTPVAKFILIKIGLMAEITDSDTLREAALKSFDTADTTSPDHPDTADWHASEQGQEQDA